jgi:hypothetical protein
MTELTRRQLGTPTTSAAPNGVAAHRVMLGKSARESVLTAEATLDGRLFGS